MTVEAVEQIEHSQLWRDTVAAVEAAEANAPRHAANYVRGFSVREPDGRVRVLTQLELLAVIRLDARGPVERYEREGCCGCRGARGDCESQPVALRLRTERGNRGMGTRSLGMVGGLCPLSKWWLAYNATRDAAAVAEARFSGELAE